MGLGGRSGRTLGGIEGRRGREERDKGEEKVLTTRMRSLMLNGNGCPVYNSGEQIVPIIMLGGAAMRFTSWIIAAGH
ncbi:uncharacterized protein A4U43_C07F9870 [Asparagus officinalis]|uniref:Uncharacterized protein n=1 Tax=Asparagus officinalis TaxID=4686 RepID=A0A5P1EAN5_ASPOF|nr:uncharacterized protein A4U43_C07F9870 [Asparagus officinalis]